MNKLVSVLFLFGLVASGLPVVVSAQQEQTQEELTEQAEQDEVVIKDVEGLRLQVAEQTQNPETQEIIFDIVVYSQIRSDRVTMTWNISGVSQLQSEERRLDFKLDPGDIKRFQIVVRPRRRGISQLNITIEAFEAQGTFLATASQPIYSYDGGLRLPVTGQFQTLQLVSSVKGIANTLLQVTIVLLVLRLGYGIFQAWLNRREEELGII